MQSPLTPSGVEGRWQCRLLAVRVSSPRKATSAQKGGGRHNCSQRVMVPWRHFQAMRPSVSRWGAQSPRYREHAGGRTSGTVGMLGPRRRLTSGHSPQGRLIQKAPAGTNPTTGQAAVICNPGGVLKSCDARLRHVGGQFTVLDGNVSEVRTMCSTVRSWSPAVLRVVLGSALAEVSSWTALSWCSRLCCFFGVTGDCVTVWQGDSVCFDDKSVFFCRVVRDSADRPLKISSVLAAVFGRRALALVRGESCEGVPR